MKTVALRYSNNFAPSEGTINAHMECIENHGFVWYGKLGTHLSYKAIEDLMSESEPRILLIHSCGSERHWAYIDKVQYEIPEREHIPAYYRNEADRFRTWFRVIKIVNAPRNIMSRCKVASSGQELGIVSRYSMSPYFKIIAPDD